MKESMASDNLDSDVNKEKDLLEKACVYLDLLEGSYPEGSKLNEKRVIRRKAAKFEARNGELWYKKTKRGLDGNQVSLFKINSTVHLVINY